MADQQKEAVAQHFDAHVQRWSDFYAEPRPRRFTQYCFYRRKLVTLAMLPEQLDVVLDAGCGPGTFIPELAPRAKTVIEMDGSTEIISAAQQVARRGWPAQVSCAAGDAENLPLADASVDGAIAVGLLEYLSDDERALAEFRRVLRPGGRVVITLPNAASPFMGLDKLYIALRQRLKRLGLVRAVFARLTGKQPAQDRAFRRTLYNAGDLDAMARRAGLSLVGWAYAAFGSYSLGDYVPFAVPISAWLDARLARSSRLGWLALNYIVTLQKPGDV